jgi:hypothetical protein
VRPKKCTAFCTAELRFDRFSAFLEQVDAPVQNPCNHRFSLYFREKSLGFFERLETQRVFESYLRSHSFPCIFNRLRKIQNFYAVFALPEIFPQTKEMPLASIKQSEELCDGGCDCVSKRHSGKFPKAKRRGESVQTVQTIVQPQFAGWTRIGTKDIQMTDCVKRHTKLPTGAVTRSKAVQVLLKTHSCQQCPECGKWAMYVPKQQRSLGARTVRVAAAD